MFLSTLDIVCLLFLVVYYMYLGAEINENFKKHIEIMMHNK